MATVDLYEDNAGALYLVKDGEAWELGWLDHSARFADHAEAWTTPGEWSPSEDDGQTRVDLNEQTGLDHDATEHVASWVDGTVTTSGHAGGAAASFLGLDED